MVRRIARSIFGGLALAMALISVPPSHAAMGRAAQRVALPQHQVGPLKLLLTLLGDSVGVFRASDSMSAPSQPTSTSPTFPAPVPSDGSDTRGAGMMIDPNGAK